MENAPTDNYLTINERNFSIIYRYDECYDSGLWIIGFSIRVERDSSQSFKIVGKKSMKFINSYVRIKFRHNVNSCIDVNQVMINMNIGLDGK